MNSSDSLNTKPASSLQQNKVTFLFTRVWVYFAKCTGCVIFSAHTIAYCFDGVFRILWHDKICTHDQEIIRLRKELCTVIIVNWNFYLHAVFGDKNFSFFISIGLFSFQLRCLIKFTLSTNIVKSRI